MQRLIPDSPIRVRKMTNGTSEDTPLLFVSQEENSYALPQ
ncbi:hypothetical protein CEXT_734731, partial [Caerostris extrusa]